MKGLSKEECARFSGARWLLNLAKEKGLEEAEKELEYRGILHMPLAIKKQDAEKTYSNIVKCLVLVSAITLWDEFDFDTDKLIKFINRFNVKADCLTQDYTTWESLQQTLQEETGIFLELPERC